VIDRSSSGLSPVIALVLGWVIPGAGHAYGGRWGKAILFFTAIMTLVGMGMILGKGSVILKDQLWFVAQVFSGGPTMALWPLSEHIATRGVDWSDRLHETGTLYTAVAGFLNVLIMMDAYLKLAFPHRAAEKEPQ
jgi:hypothetical protein